MKKLSFFAVFAALALQQVASAQQSTGLSSMGEDFYFTELAPSIKCAAIKQFQAYYLLISAPYDCDMTISYFDVLYGETSWKTFPVRAKSSFQLPLDHTFMNQLDRNSDPINPDGETPMYSSCHIHSSRPISVSYYSSGPNSGALTMLLPTAVLGKDYVIANLPANPGVGAADSHHFPCSVDSASSEFAVLAIKDSTKVTIVPNGLTRKGHLGTNTGIGATGRQHPLSITLSRGEVYWIKSAINDRTDDMSGSIVTASAPIAVFAGNEDAIHGMDAFVSAGGDQRNMILQEMVPTQYWSDRDIVSMPFRDTPGLDPGDASAGDEFKIFARDSVLTTVNVSIDSIGTEQAEIAQTGNPLASFGNVENTMNASANRKIMVEQYDYRAQNKAPNTAPTMMNVVPLQDFGRVFCFMVPDDKSETQLVRYINVIARTDQLTRIFVWHNNSSPLALSVLTPVGGPYRVPNHPELRAECFQVSPGSYFIEGDSSFIVYQYGTLGIDPDFDFGDNDDDDYYFEYAAPVGETFHFDGAGSPTATVDTVCGGWNVIARDTAAADGGIASVELLNDSDGIILRKPGMNSGYVSTNVDFEPANFTVVPGDTSVSFKIVNSFWTNATAWVVVTNAAGNSKLFPLTYTPQKLSLTPDSIYFLNSKSEVDTCATIVLRNASMTGQPIIVSGYRLSNSSQGYWISGTFPALPATLAMGDSIVFNVCFNSDSGFKFDSLIIAAGCFEPTVPLFGSTEVGAISASDYDFGDVLVGHTACHTVRVWNSGTAPFTLTRQWVLDNFENFTFEDTSKLPLILPPGVSNGVDLNFCYTPTQDTTEDSTQMHWATDLPKPFSEEIKSFSILRGHGVEADLRWDQAESLFGSNVSIQRLTLHNDGTAPAIVDTVKIIGPDTSEFHFIDTRSNFAPVNPMTTPFMLYPVNSVGTLTTEWVDIQFTPDTTILRTRIDTLIAIDNLGTHPFVILNGIIGNLSVAATPSYISSDIRVIPSRGNVEVILPPELVGAHITIFDELGRELRASESTSQTESLDVATLPSGTYYLRASKGNIVKTATFMIAH